MCPNMIQCDTLDLSECRSEEVISFFWRSVYIAPLFYIYKNTNYIGKY